MAQVIEDAEKQHDVERPHTLRREIHHVDIDILHPRFEHLAGERKSCFRAPPGSVPGIVVGCDDARGAPPLALE